MIMSYHNSTVKGNFYTIQVHRSVGQRNLSAGNSRRWSHSSDEERAKPQVLFQVFFNEVTQIKFQVVQLKNMSAVQLMNLSLEVIHQERR